MPTLLSLVVKTDSGNDANFVVTGDVIITTITRLTASDDKVGTSLFLVTLCLLIVCVALIAKKLKKFSNFSLIAIEFQWQFCRASLTSLVK